MEEAAVNITANLEKTRPISWRRNSTGNINTRIVSRYLSAPMASCHDSCKFGTKSTNGKAAIPRTILLHKRSIAPKLQKKWASDGEAMEMEKEKKKLTGSLRLPSDPKKQRRSCAATRKVSAGCDHVSADHQSSSKTNRISRSRQKGSSIQSYEVKGTSSTKHRNSSIPRQTRRVTKQEEEEHVPEKTICVVPEHKEDSSCCSESKFEESELLDSVQENVSDLPRKLVLVEGKLCNDGDSPRKVVVQYIFVGDEKDSMELFDSKMEERTEAEDFLSNVDVKTLIGVFESVFSANKPAAENLFSNVDVKTLIGVFESVIGCSSPYRVRS